MNFWLNVLLELSIKLAFNLSDSQNALVIFVSVPMYLNFLIVWAVSVLPILPCI